MTDLLPWHQREEEPADRFEAFVEYLRLGPNRSLRKLWEAGTAEGVIGVTRGTLELWSSTHSWVTRAAAWDRHELASRIEERVFVRERVRGRVLQRANRLVDKLCDIALGKGKGKADAAQVKALLGALAIAGISELRSLEVNTESTVKVEAARASRMPLETLTVEQLREIKAVLSRKLPATIDVTDEVDEGLNEDDGTADPSDLGGPCT